MVGSCYRRKNKETECWRYLFLHSGHPVPALRGRSVVRCIFGQMNSSSELLIDSTLAEWTLWCRILC